MMNVGEAIKETKKLSDRAEELNLSDKEEIRDLKGEIVDGLGKQLGIENATLDELCELIEDKPPEGTVYSMGEDDDYSTFNEIPEGGVLSHQPSEAAPEGGESAAVTEDKVEEAKVEEVEGKTEQPPKPEEKQVNQSGEAVPEVKESKYKFYAGKDVKVDELTDFEVYDLGNNDMLITKPYADVKDKDEFLKFFDVNATDENRIEVKDENKFLIKNTSTSNGPSVSLVKKIIEILKEIPDDKKVEFIQEKLSQYGFYARGEKQWILEKLVSFDVINTDNMDTILGWKSKFIETDMNSIREKFKALLDEGKMFYKCKGEFFENVYYAIIIKIEENKFLVTNYYRTALGKDCNVIFKEISKFSDMLRGENIEDCTKRIDGREGTVVLDYINENHNNAITLEEFKKNKDIEVLWNIVNNKSEFSHIKGESIDINNVRGLDLDGNKYLIYNSIGEVKPGIPLAESVDNILNEGNYEKLEENINAKFNILYYKMKTGNLESKGKFEERQADRCLDRRFTMRQLVTVYNEYKNESENIEKLRKSCSDKCGIDEVLFAYILSYIDQGKGVGLIDALFNEKSTFYKLCDEEINENDIGKTIECIIVSPFKFLFYKAVPEGSSNKERIEAIKKIIESKSRQEYKITEETKKSILISYKKGKILDIDRYKKKVYKEEYGERILNEEAVAIYDMVKGEKKLNDGNKENGETMMITMKIYESLQSELGKKSNGESSKDSGKDSKKEANEEADKQSTVKESSRDETEGKKEKGHRFRNPSNRKKK